MNYYNLHALYISFEGISLQLDIPLIIFTVQEEVSQKAGY